MTKKTSLFFLLCMSAALCRGWAATDKSSVEVVVTTRVIPSGVTLGQEARLVIQADFPKGFSMAPFKADNLTLKPFELRRIDKPVVRQKDGRILQTVTLRLAIYEMGDFEVPSIPVAVWNVAGQRGETRTRPSPVRVVGVAKKKDDKGDIRPIKGPIQQIGRAHV